MIGRAFMSEQANSNNVGTMADFHPPSDSPFCAFNSLSGPIAPFARELSERYGITVEPILALCLAVAGDAVGIGPQLNTGLGADQPGTNLHVAIAPGANSSFKYVLSHILAPIRAFQTNRFADYGSNDPALLVSQTEKMEKEFAAWMERDFYPNAQHQLIYETELAHLKALVRPICFLESPTPKQLVAALGKSAGSILVVTDAPATQSLLDDMADLLRATWRRQPFLRPFLAGQSLHIPAEPALSLICMCSPGTINQLLTDESVLENGLSQQFLIWQMGDNPGKLTEAALLPLQHQSSWDRLIRRLLSVRVQPPRVYELLNESKSLLFGFTNDVSAISDSGLLPDQAGRIALIHHLCQDEPGPTVERATMWEAIGLTRRFAAHRRESVPQPIPEQADCVLAAAAQIMLAKIRRHKPLRARELFRLYWNQKKETHQPVLNYLLTAGLVQDQGGYLMAVESSAPGDQTQAESSESAVGKVSLMTA